MNFCVALTDLTNEEDILQSPILINGNTFEENFSGYLSGVIDLHLLPYVVLSGNSFENNGPAFQEHFENYSPLFESSNTFILEKLVQDPGHDHEEEDTWESASDAGLQNILTQCASEIISSSEEEEEDDDDILEGDCIENYYPNRVNSHFI
jgi:hypothetical protein